MVMTRTRWLRMLASLFSLGLWWPAVGSAQTEAGVARDNRTGSPLECLHVVLADSVDRAVAHAVTDSAGQFMLEAPHPGTYRVRFELYGWEPLLGPLDTLADGAFKQRRYPLDFASVMMPSGLPRRTALDSAESVHAEHDRQEREAYRRFNNALRAREDVTAWRSRFGVLPSGVKFTYPRELYKRSLQGSVVAQFIVDSTGKPRVDTYRAIRVAHPDFEKVVRPILVDSVQWSPALLLGRPVCELTRGVVEFSLDLSSPSVKWMRFNTLF